MSIQYKTYERTMLAIELWPQRVTTGDIVDRVNALKGPRVIAKHIRDWMRTHGIRRDPVFAKEQFAAGSQRASDRSLEVRREQKARAPHGLIYTPTWPYERVCRLIELKKGGKDRAEIARVLGCSVNGIVGKTHRLVQLGLLTVATTKAVMVVAKPLPKPPKLQLPKKEKAVQVFAAMPVKVVHQIPKPISVGHHTKGHREMVFGIGTLSGIDIARIKAPARGQCAWPRVCCNPTEGHFCEVHRTLIRAAA